MTQCLGYISKNVRCENEGKKRGRRSKFCKRCESDRDTYYQQKEIKKKENIERQRLKQQERDRQKAFKLQNDRLEHSHTYTHLKMKHLSQPFNAFMTLLIHCSSFIDLKNVHTYKHLYEIIKKSLCSQRIFIADFYYMHGIEELFMIHHMSSLPNIIIGLVVDYLPCEQSIELMDPFTNEIFNYLSYVSVDIIRNLPCCADLNDMEYISEQKCIKYDMKIKKFELERVNYLKTVEPNSTFIEIMLQKTITTNYIKQLLKMNEKHVNMINFHTYSFLKLKTTGIDWNELSYMPNATHIINNYESSDSDNDMPGLESD